MLLTLPAVVKHYEHSMHPMLNSSHQRQRQAFILTAEFRLVNNYLISAVRGRVSLLTTDII